MEDHLDMVIAANNAEADRLENTLSKDLQFWRAERPDEWTMDDFIRRAKELEAEVKRLKAECADRHDLLEEICEVVDKWRA